MACGGMIFIKKFQILEKKISFYFISFNFLILLLLLINLKRQSEHSGLRPDTSSLVNFENIFFINEFSVINRKIRPNELGTINFRANKLHI